MEKEIETDLIHSNVVVILLSYNQKGNTLNCIKSLLEMDYPNLQIVLNVNNSDDGTDESVMKEFPEVVVLTPDQNLGCSKGRNLAINYAIDNLSFQYYLVLDNDTIVEKDLLKNLVKGLQSDNEIGIVYPKIYYFDNSNIIQLAGKLKMNYLTGKFNSEGIGKIDDGSFDKPVFSSICSGPCFLAKRELVDQVGGYDPIYDPYGYEDLDLILRASKGKAKIMYVPSAVIYHKESRTPTKGKYNEEFAKLKGRNMKIFLKRHSPPMQYILFHFVAPFVLLVSLIRQRNFNIIISLIKSFFKKNSDEK